MGRTRRSGPSRRGREGHRAAAQRARRTASGPRRAGGRGPVGRGPVGRWAGARRPDDDPLSPRPVPRRSLVADRPDRRLRRARGEYLRHVLRAILW